MPRTAELIVTFDGDGNPSIEVINGDGKTCTDLTANIEKALGTVAKREFKPEAHRNHPIQNRISVR